MLLRSWAQALLLLNSLLFAGVVCDTRRGLQSDEKIPKGGARCRVVLQGTVKGCSAKSDFDICQADLMCEGEKVEVEGHPALAPFVEKFEGVNYKERRKAGALLKFLKPTVLLVDNSVINNLMVNKAELYLLDFASGMNVTFRKSGFFNNTGKFRAPLRLRGGELTVQESTFVHNVAKRTGAIEIEDSSLFVNGSSFANNGRSNKAPEVGILRASRSTAAVQRSAITQNFGRRTGALLVTDGSNVAVSFTDIVQNTAVPPKGRDSWTGGAVLVEDSAFALTSCPLKRNSAPHGGAVAAVGDADVSAEESEVHNNESDGDLGVFAILNPRDNSTSAGESVDFAHLRLRGISFDQEKGKVVQVTCGTPEDFVQVYADADNVSTMRSNEATVRGVRVETQDVYC